MSYEFNFRAGEYLVDKDKWEAPHLMEHVLLGANELIPKARTFQAEFEKNGAYSNASTGSYEISYEAECADFEWDRILDLLKTAVAKPLFLEDEFTSEFGNVREELTSRSNSHYRHLSLAMRQAFGFQSLTDKERLKLMNNVNVEDVREHYKRTHTSENLRFVIAGKLPMKRRKIIRELLSSIELPSDGERFDLPNEDPATLSKPLYIHNDTVKNMYFYLDTFMSRRLRDPEQDALNLVNSMLTATLYSRILGTAREKGLVYGMNSAVSQTKLATNWWFGSQVMPRNADALFDIIRKELQAVFEGNISEEDTQAAKQYALGRFQRSGQTVAGVADGYASRYFFDEVIDDYYKMPERIRAVSRNRIVSVTQSMFHDNVWGLGVLGSVGDDFVDKLQKKVQPLWK
jgi:predicted Zn-dependent peptidase